MSVSRAYVPLSGSQVYVLPARVTSNAQDLATAAARTPELDAQVRWPQGSRSNAVAQHILCPVSEHVLHVDVHIVHVPDRPVK